MNKKLITIGILELCISERLYEHEFQAIYADYVLRIGGNAGIGFMGKMGWDATQRGQFRNSLKEAGIEIHKDPPVVLPGFVFDPNEGVVRVNRGEFPL